MAQARLKCYNHPMSNLFKGVFALVAGTCLEAIRAKFKEFHK